MTTMTVELTSDDTALLRMIDAGVAGRSAQAHEVVPLKAHWKSDKCKAAIRRFRRLVLIGAIDHRRNGYCYVTPAALAALGIERRPYATE